ncbi:rhamnogalacturonan acetylesterase [Aurantibacter crassamenti]|uniref:rhamnogalacturonan acetylesterase n=1 Tax=Aurantibacter crassamenti TaxID=1837375 RepID=UPI00193A39CC|nr:rhamnogalacturonan acetylesterase [Aurantibacter crassamenti]MBM1105841.1 rhamnogalacturonan acetylesterase [Aurantibacter crassamenti]
MKIVFILFMFLSVVCNAQQTTIYCIGDSTMSDKENPEINPEHGWAQVLPQFFTDEVSVDNRAVNGRSTKSFITEKKWDSVYSILKPQDYVFIQFGHNDQKVKDSSRYTNPHTTYRHNLIRFVNETRQKGATPILFSSIVRRNFNEHGTLIDTHGAYPLEARLVALEMEVPFIDLQYLTEVLETSYGPYESKKLHLHFKPGEHQYYPDGKEDNTHLSKEGALAISDLVIKEITALNLPLAKLIRQ